MNAIEELSRANAQVRKLERELRLLREHNAALESRLAPYAKIERELLPRQPSRLRELAEASESSEATP